MNIDKLLLEVEKPARYIGNEVNVINKNPKDVDVRFLFAFPDVYEIGMSHLGLQIVYYMLNKREDIFCERVFSPWVDMEKLMIENNIPLFSIETRSEVKEFDFLGFTLQYEMSYTNILNMLKLGNVPLLSKDREEEHPLIIGGGPCVYNPEPLAEIFDLFFVGEAEEGLLDVIDLYKEIKKSGGTKKEFLKAVVKFDFIYVPKFYDVQYNEDKTIQKMVRLKDFAPEKINKTYVKNLDTVFYPKKQLVPLIETVHDRVQLEVFRGCIHGCRFCQAGFTYRTVREKSVETLTKQAKELIENSGHEEISLVSLSTADYTKFKELANSLLDTFKDEKVNISLPSTRIDSFSIDILEKIQGRRKSGMTFAPEAGSQRLRNVINKNITEEQILNGASLAFKGGWNRIKLYFVIGLPTEEYIDLEGIGELAGKIVDEHKKLPIGTNKKQPAVNVSTSCFVPKPFTPFQWAPQNDYTTFMEKQKFVKSSIRVNKNKGNIKYNYHQADISILEGIIARGDRKIGELLIKVHQKGGKFDSWSEHFNKDIWNSSIAEMGLDVDFYTTRQRETKEILPWDFINIGIEKKFFIKEFEKALKESITEDCRSKCSKCGMPCHRS